MELFQKIQFLNPGFLILLNLIYGLMAVWFAVFVLRTLMRPRTATGARPIFIGRMRYLIPFLFATALAITALARPVVADAPLEISKSPVEAMFVVDNSASMWVKDLGPQRIEVAKRDILALFANRVLREGDKVGLVVLARGAARKLRLTADLQAFVDRLGMVVQPPVVTTDVFPWGSDIAFGLRQAQLFLDDQDRRRSGLGNRWRPTVNNDRIVIFFGDGDYDLDDSPAQARMMEEVLAEFNKRGLRIYAVGVGTRAETRLDGILNYYKPSQYDDKLPGELAGQLTRLRTDALNHITRRTGGTMTTVESVSQSSENFLRNAIDARRRPSINLVQDFKGREFWREFLLASLACVLLGILLYKR